MRFTHYSACFKPRGAALIVLPGTLALAVGTFQRARLEAYNHGAVNIT